MRCPRAQREPRSNGFVALSTAQQDVSTLGAGPADRGGVTSSIGTPDGEDRTDYGGDNRTLRSPPHGLW
jgi:hypothetical protein